MSDKMAGILEKLSFDRMFKPQIDLIWKVIERDYVNSSKDVVRRNFNFHYVTFYPEHSDIKDLRGIYWAVKVKYNFNEAKRLFVKEPFMCFCIDSSKAYFDFGENVKERERSDFFDTLNYNASRRTLKYVKENYPTCYEFLIKEMGYNENKEEAYVESGHISKMEYYPQGDYLIDNCYQYIKKHIDTMKPEYEHRVQGIDHNLFPMFIWDIDGGFIYSCRTDHIKLKLDRKILSSRKFARTTPQYFMKGVPITDDASKIGFPYYGGGGGYREII